MKSSGNVIGWFNRSVLAWVLNSFQLAGKLPSYVNPEVSAHRCTGEILIQASQLPAQNGEVVEGPDGEVPGDHLRSY